MADDIMNLDLYELIGAESTASVKEIKSAYRKKALSCHPDKNKNNPKAAELFHQLSKALEVLTDETARAAYDKVQNARKQAKIRASQLDSKRRKFKEDLEAREEAHRLSQSSTVRSDEQKLKAEIERLQKEGSRQVEEEIAFVKQQIYQQMFSKPKDEDVGGTNVKIRWKAAKDDPQNGGYNYQNLFNILSKHGDIAALALLPNKNGRAIVEFKDKSAAKSAVDMELGLTSNPLTLKGLWQTDDQPRPAPLSSNMFAATSNTSGNVFPSANLSSFPSATKILEMASKSDSDFEAEVFRNMRRAEERKKLIEQMKAEES